MPDRKRKPERTTPHPDKTCQRCGRAFSWRKKWERDWDEVKYCSDACRGAKPSEADALLEAAILDLLSARGRDKTICPSEAAKMVGGKNSRDDWESLMEPARAAARRLVSAGGIVITQKGQIVDPLRLRANPPAADVILSLEAADPFDVGIETPMTLNKHPNDPPEGSTTSSSRTLIIVITVIILLAVGYTVVRTLAVPRASGGQTTQPTK